MWSSLIVIVVGALTLYLSKQHVNCSDIEFKEIIKKFEWTESSRNPIVSKNKNLKFPPRSYDRATLKLQCSLEGEPLKVSNQRLPDDFGKDPFYLKLKTKPQLNENSDGGSVCEWILLKSKPIELPQSNEKYFIVTPNQLELPMVLMQMIFDFLDVEKLFDLLRDLPEYYELVDSVIFNRIAKIFPGLVHENTCFPIYSAEKFKRKEISRPQVKSLETAAKLLNQIYPSLDLKVISSLKDLAALLAISWIISRNSNKLRATESRLKVVQFISIFSSRVLKSLDKKLNRTVLFNRLIRAIIRKNCKLVIEFLFETKCIENLSILASNSYWKLFKNYKSEEKFRLMFDKVQVENVISKNLVRENIIRILKITDSALLLKTYISHDICDEINEDFMTTLMATVFEHSMTNVMNELIRNHVTLAYLIANPLDSKKVKKCQYSMRSSNSYSSSDSDSDSDSD